MPLLSIFFLWKYFLSSLNVFFFMIKNLINTDRAFIYLNKLKLSFLFLNLRQNKFLIISWCIYLVDCPRALQLIQSKIKKWLLFICVDVCFLPLFLHLLNFFQSFLGPLLFLFANSFFVLFELFPPSVLIFLDPFTFLFLSFLPRLFVFIIKIVDMLEPLFEFFWIKLMSGWRRRRLRFRNYGFQVCRRLPFLATRLLQEASSSRILCYGKSHRRARTRISLLSPITSLAYRFWWSWCCNRDLRDLMVTTMEHIDQNLLLLWIELTNLQFWVRRWQ